MRKEKKKMKLIAKKIKEYIKKSKRASAKTDAGALCYHNKGEIL